ncbi:MAG: Na+/H+ antiporter NhaA [Phycisphaerae bacterium]|nr:Na+/H+ antiporter NhaA [Phycisphaerae bacterium]
MKALGLEKFLRNDASKGILLIIATVLALLMANSEWNEVYRKVLALPVPMPGKDFTVLLFINDFLMAAFFLLVGMELKREVADGELRSRSRVMLPALAALGGMVGPAVLYWAFNRADHASLAGWAIPCATDIAFALGILALLGNRVPTGLKVFLTALAVLDDLGAIIIIALFYTANLSKWFLLGAVALMVVMWLINRRGVTRIWVYLLFGTVMWWFMLMSGVHATLAGVATAMVIPLRDRSDRKVMEHFEHQLAPLINFKVLPIFALANAGVTFGNLGAEGITSHVSMGTAVGLIGGKVFGVFGAAWLAVKLKLGTLPASMTWRGLFGVSILCGIGFTMSIFIAELAFARHGTDPMADAVASMHLDQAKAGILIGSFASAILGISVLALVLPRKSIAPADLPID